MLHAAVGDQEGLAVADLPVDDPGQIDARLADQPAAELDREPAVLRGSPGGPPTLAESAAPTDSTSSGCSPWKWGMPKPPPRLTSGGVAPTLRQARAASATRGACASIRACGVERLRAGEDVEAAPVGAGVEDAPDQRRHARGIDPERLGAAAHPHARALDLEIGIDPDREPRPAAELGGDRQRALDLALGFGVEGDAGLDRLGKVGVALAGAGEADPAASAPASSAKSSSPAEAMSRPSTCLATWLSNGM